MTSYVPFDNRPTSMANQNHRHQTTSKKLGQDSRKKFVGVSGSRPQQPLTVAQVKRLRQKRLAALSFSQQALFNGDILLQIPEDGEAVFNDPPLDHVRDDISVSHIYNDIEKQKGRRNYNAAGANATVNANVVVDGDGDDDANGSKIVVIYEESDSHSHESSRTSTTANSSEMGQVQEVSVTNIPSSPASSKHNRNGGPVDLDDSLDSDDATDRSADVTITTAGGPIDVDKIQETDDQFNAIWREHEDEFLVWQEGAKHTVMTAKGIKRNGRYECVENKLYNGLPIHTETPSDSESPNDSMTLVSYSSLDTFGFAGKKAEEYEAPPVKSRTSVDSESHKDFKKTAANTPLSIQSRISADSESHKDCKQAVEYKASRIHSRISVDSESREDLKEAADYKVSTVNSRISVDSESREDFKEAADYKVSPVNSRISVDSESHEDFKEAADYKVSPVNSRISVDSDSHKDSVTIVTRSSQDTYGFIRENRAVEHKAPRVNSRISIGSECPEDSLTIFTYRSDTFDFLTKKTTATADTVSTNSLLSEPTKQDSQNITANETKSRLFLKLNPKTEGRWDDISSIGCSMVEQETTVIGKHGYGRRDRVNLRELQGHDVEEPPFYYNSSVKTPPICYMNPKIRAQIEQHDTKPRQSYRSDGYEEHYSSESKWDDVSSIGLLGVETINKNLKEKLSKFGCPDQGAPAIPFVIQPRPEEDSDDESSLVEIGRNRKINDIFRKRISLADSDDENGKSQATPTFSTLWAEDTSTTEKPKKKSSNNASHLELNPTFSTVWVEDCDSFYSDTSADLSDVEMPPASHKDEVSNTTIGSDSDIFSYKIQTLALTEFHWICITATVIVVITVASIACFALYVNSGA
eukprot:jgi/Psemu1/285776/fgenesh1_pg.101_\